MINHHIDLAISLLEDHQNYIDLYEDVEEYGDNLVIDFYEDKLEFNQNIKKIDKSDAEFLSNCRKHLEYHEAELEKAKVRLTICMLTFNKGWIF
jgi:hypothetical protein